MEYDINKIGNTPLVRLEKIEKEFNLKAKLYAKLEMNNPGGSIKDRTALAMILDKEEKDEIKPGCYIVEATSGNTGIAVSWISKIKGYKPVIFMPNNMSQERINILKSLDAIINLTPSEEGISFSTKKALEFVNCNYNSIILSQFENNANPLAHYKWTGPEIYKDTNGLIDILVAGLGTGGTISGCGKYLKEKKDVKIIAVEPLNSPILNGGSVGLHQIDGIGPNFIPSILDINLIDEIYDCSDNDAYYFCKKLFQTENIFAGISSGAALAAAIKEAKKTINEGKTIVVIFPDGGEKYISTGVFN